MRSRESYNTVGMLARPRGRQNGGIERGLGRPQQIAEIPPRLLTTQGVAGYLGCSRCQLFRQSILLTIPYVMIGRREYYDIRDVDKWVDEHKQFTIHPE